MPALAHSHRLVLAQCRLHHHLPPQPRRLLHAPHASSSSSASYPPPRSEILSIRESLLSGRRSAAEVASEYLGRLREAEPSLRSFLHVAEAEEVLRQAGEVDRAMEMGEELGPLAGVLVGVKDNICTADMPSTGGSRILEGYRPAFDATAVRRLRERGAILVGKTNLDEFGMGSTTEGSGFQVTANPWDVSRVPGGSSGGSAAAVSARQCVVSLGSDTGGSVRQPASFCGVVGIKPTYGRVSRFGLMAYASSLDVIGCFGSSVVDSAILLKAISGHDRFDATSSKHEVPDYVSELISTDYMDSKPLKGVRIGVIRETLGEGVDAEIISSIQSASVHLEDLGSVVTEVSLPSFSLGLPAYYILASSESSSNLSRYDGIRYGNQVPEDELISLYGNSRANGFGSEVKMRILMGTYALSAGYYDAYYKRAQQVRTLVQKSFKDALDQNDILISPAAPSAAYKLGEKISDPLAMYAGDIMTIISSASMSSSGNEKSAVTVVEEDEVSSRRSTRRSMTDHPRRRSMRPPHAHHLDAQLKPFPDDVMRWMNVCRERYEQGSASGPARSGSSSRDREKEEKEEAEIQECVTMLKALPGLAREQLYPAITLFGVASNRRIFRALEDDQHRVNWVIHMISR